MFGVSFSELLIIALVGIIVLGPEKLPKIMRTVAKVMSEFRRITTDLQRTVNAELALEEHERLQKEAEERIMKRSAQAKQAPSATQETADTTTLTTPVQEDAAGEKPMPQEVTAGTSGAEKTDRGEA